jgi:hypothetical protein
MPRTYSPLNRWPAVALLMATLCFCSGCGAMATVQYWLYGLKVDAKFDGLKKKRVAVVCLDSNSLKGPGSEADAIAKAVSTILSYHVEDVEMISQSKIADWIDSHDQDLTDYRDIGRGVKADMVVGLDLESFSTHEGQTLLKGRAKVSIRVFDMAKGGEVVYEAPTNEISFPEHGARHVTENESKFTIAFIHILAQKIAKDFYSYDKLEDFGNDATFMGD